MGHVPGEVLAKTLGDSMQIPWIHRVAGLPALIFQITHIAHRHFAK